MLAPDLLDFQLPNVRLSCLAWGAPDAPLVVALHGFPDTAWTWRHLGPHLAERGRRVVAPFLRGYAPSSLAGDGSYHVGALMADTVALHDALGGDDRAVLVGHDWGAITASALAAHGESPFERVVTLAVPPLAAMSGSPLRLIPRQLRLSWYIAYHQLPYLPERTFDRELRRLWRDWSPGFDAEEDLQRVRAGLPDRAHRGAAIGFYRAFRSPWTVPAAYRPWQATLTTMPTAPLLNLHGADDGCLQAGYAAHAATRLPPTASAEIVPGAGHFLQVERPAEVNERIGAFLESRP